MLGLCFYFLASNPAFAVGDYSNETWNNDVDYYKESIDESGIYKDSTLTDWHWYIAGDPNNGDTTDDGFCFMYDGGNYGGTPFAVYNAIDITQCAFYNNPDYLNIEWYSFSDLNMIAEPDTSPIGIYQGQQAYVGVVDSDTNIFGNGSEYWSGCYATGDTPTWGAIGGGECPIINNGSDQINWGYMQQSLTQISAIDSALKNAGLETYGYTYSWMVKNADANEEATNGQDGQDTLTVTLAVKDNGGNIVYKKEFDYSYWIDNWTNFSGDENFDTPFDVSKLDSVMLEVTGQDVGNWEGYFGPEFNEPNVKLKFRPIIEDNTEQLLFESMCMNDPLYDVNCPGYQTAMMDQMNEAAGATDLTGGTQNALADALNNGGTDAFGNDLTQLEDPTGQAGALAQETGAPANDGQETGAPANDGQEAVAEETTDPVQESVAEAMTDPVQEAVEEATGEPSPVQEEATAEATVDTTNETKSSSTGLNATQLSAVNAANNVANSAVSASADAAQASTGIGLSESGGVSSTLTSVDPTGSTSAAGSVASSTDFSGGTDGSTVVTVEPMQNTNTGQPFDSSQVAAVDSSVSNTSGSDTGNTQTFDSSQGTTVDSSTADSSTASVDITQTFGGSQDTSVTQSFGNSGSDNGQSQNSSTGSNNGQQSNDSFGTTDFANTGQTAIQDDNPLADGGTVQTTDITGEDALATSNESLVQLTMLNDPTNPINQIINDITANIITQAVTDAEETAEESAEESVESQNAQEDALVAEALAGSDDEDAQSALLGYNPNFRAYQQPQMQGGEIYNDQGVYENQKTYDNPSAGLFNGASDALHREMVRSQYD